MSDPHGLTHDHSPCSDPRLVTIKPWPAGGSGPARGVPAKLCARAGITFSSDLDWARHGAQPTPP